MKTIKYTIFCLFALMTFVFGEYGKASIYSTSTNRGTKTASGIKLEDQAEMVAHKHHPFGTILKITNLNNKKWTLGVVVDRGPFVKGRIVDLTTGVANKLLITKKQGLAPVKVEVVGKVNIK